MTADITMGRLIRSYSACQGVPEGSPEYLDTEIISETLLELPQLDLHRLSSKRTFFLSADHRFGKCICAADVFK